MGSELEKAFQRRLRAKTEQEEVSKRDRDAYEKEEGAKRVSAKEAGERLIQIPEISAVLELTDEVSKGISNRVGEPLKRHLSYSWERIVETYGEPHWTPCDPPKRGTNKPPIRISVDYSSESGEYGLHYNIGLYGRDYVVQQGTTGMSGHISIIEELGQRESVQNLADYFVHFLDNKSNYTHIRAVSSETPSIT